MKCTKCGADCDPRQLFCLRCGTPLNANKSEEEVIKEVEVPIEDMVGVISLDDEDDDIDIIIGRDLAEARNRDVGSRRTDSAGSSNRMSGGTGESGANRNRPSGSRSGNRPSGSATGANRNIPSGGGSGTSGGRPSGNNSRQGQNRSDISRKQPEENKKKAIIGICIAVVALIVVVVVLVLVFGGTGNYDDYYQKGLNLYEKGQVQSSITQFEKAADAAKTDDEKKDVYVMLWKAYSQVDGYERDEIDILKKLIALEPDNQTYYEALITIYRDLEDQDAIDELIESVSNKELQENLMKFDGTTPVATIEAGEYDKPISVGLTASADSTIHYTINGGDATSSSDVYTSSIELKDEGEYIIKAVGIDNEGNQSKQFVGKYILNFGTVNAPVVSLDSGTYNEREKVTVTADAGCTIYYTTDGTIPTADSKEYKKPFKIPEVNTVYYFIAIDEKGVSSDVVTRVYDYKKVYTYDYNRAVSGLTNVLISKGIMENTFGSYEDGSAMYLKYESVEKIDTEYYYIISATKESEQGNTISSETYAFGCDNGMSYAVKFTGGQYQLSQIE